MDDGDTAILIILIVIIGIMTMCISIQSLETEIVQDQVLHGVCINLTGNDSARYYNTNKQNDELRCRLGDEVTIYTVEKLMEV